MSIPQLEALTGRHDPAPQHPRGFRLDDVDGHAGAINQYDGRGYDARGHRNQYVE